MGKDETKNNLNAFGNLNIEDIEEGLGLVMPGSGESGKTETEKKQTDGLMPGALDLSQKIQIPETEEELNQFKEKDKTDGEGSEEEEKGDEGKEKNLGEEDALITEDSPLYLHAATLHEEGILPTLDLDSLKGKKYSEAVKLYLEAQKAYIEEGRDEYKNSLTERQRDFLEFIEKGVPQEQAEHQFNIEESYGKITDEILSDDSDLQEQIIIQNLQLKGLSEKQVQIFIKAAKDDERLFEEAKDARNDINTFIGNQRKELLKKAEDEERAAVKRDEELQKTIKTTINSTEEILPGIKISANEKTRLYELMTKPVETRIINGQKVPINLINKVRSEDRITFDLRLNYFIEQGMFKKDFDLSKLNKKLTSSAAAKLEKKLKDGVGHPEGGLTFEKKKEDKTKVPPIVFPQF